MSRFIQPLPFSEGYEFTVRRVATISGVQYGPGDLLCKDGLNPRRLRQMYELRLISPVVPDGSHPVPVKRPTYKTAKVPVMAAQEAAQPLAEPVEAPQPDIGPGEPVEPVTQPVAASDQEPVETVQGAPAKAEHRGFGRWFVTMPDGTEVGPMSKDQAETMVRAA